MISPQSGVRSSNEKFGSQNVSDEQHVGLNFISDKVNLGGEEATVSATADSHSTSLRAGLREAKRTATKARSGAAIEMAAVVAGSG
jgi:hypothetical protein